MATMIRRAMEKMEFVKMLGDAWDDLRTEANETVERIECHIAQYRRHIENMEQDARESEGAALVLARLQRVLVRLRRYRKLLQHLADRG